MSNLILIGAGLIALSILSSVFAFRFGTPLLLVFLGIGLIAGEGGLGLVFNNAEQAYFIGSIALAIILFDSGFGTRKQAIQRAAAPAFVLATLGVLLTTLLVGVAAKFIFDFSWLYAFLIGAIVSSTDAAAVFFLLRAGGVKIYKRVRSVLEVESGSNDPMAIFLTILIIELILSGSSNNLYMSFFQGFLLQMGLGLILGVAGGYLIVNIVNRIQLEEALYPILVLACALCVFGLVSYVGGSGFLAVYVAGIVAGNRPMKISSVLRRHQEGMTWLAQIVMFLVLGLFATPSEFGSVLFPALLLGLFLIFIGRPVAVVLCLLPFRYDRRTIAFNSWVGLRGAVSILLAILPIVMGVEGADDFVNIAFIMVVTSLIVQGWTIKPAAKWLQLILPSESGPSERFALELPGNPNHELLVYKVIEESPLVTSEIALPQWARPALIVRDEVSMHAEHVDKFVVDDLVYFFVSPEYASLLDRFFSKTQSDTTDDKMFFGEFVVNSNAALNDIVAFYDLGVDRVFSPTLSVKDFMSSNLKGNPVVGDRVPIGKVDLVVRRVYHGEITSEVGISLMPENRNPAFVRRYENNQHGLIAKVTRFFQRG